MSQTNANYGEEELIPDATTNDVGLLATSHIHFETMDLQLGARYDNRSINVENGLNKNFNSFNGAFGIKKDFTDELITRVNLASGFRAPNLAELTSDGSHEGTNRYEIGNSNLNNEQNFQVDVAIEYNAQHMELFVNGFYNKVNNYIFLSPNGDIIDEDPVFVYLQNDAKLFGGEVGLHFHPHPLDWLHIENTFETVTGKLQDDSHLPLIPANKITNTIRVEFEKNWFKKGYAFVRLLTYLKQNNISAFETVTPSYALLSTGIGGEFRVFNNVLSLSISGNNLTNRTYVNHLSRLKPDGIFNMGRNVSFALSYTL
jgi:iron complex outermembrane receptor protein